MRSGTTAFVEEERCQPPLPLVVLGPAYAVGRGPAVAAKKSRPLTERARRDAPDERSICGQWRALHWFLSLSPCSRCSRSPVARSRRARPCVAEPTV